MKAHLYRTILATVLAISLGTLASERLFAKTCAPFPDGVVPFIKLYYISGANSEGDRMVLGEMDLNTGSILLNQIPLPDSLNQKFCGSIGIAPGLHVEAYVPTAQERSLDFSAFVGSLLDPVTRRFDLSYGEFLMDPFPSNIIPRDRFPLFAWRISPAVFTSTISVPMVLSLAGANNSFYSSELTLANRGFADLNLEFNYTAAFGQGSGIVTDTLPAGRQKILPDALAYLRFLGLPIQLSENNGGTLTVKASGLASPSDVAVTVRTTTALSEGRAGLAYAGNLMWKNLGGTGSSYISGLRQNATDRSNVAVMHAGNPEDGEIVLRLTVISGESPFAELTLPDITLAPGGFHQIDSVLVSNGLSLSNGYVRIERISGTAPYYAYGVINDQVNSDGSFVPSALPMFVSSFIVPVIVENRIYTSELILTNSSATLKRVEFSFVAEAIQAQSHSANFSIELSAGQQLILPNLVQYLRDRGIPGIGPQGTNFVGALLANVPGVDIEDTGSGAGIFIGTRVSTPSKSGGEFGVLYPGVPFDPDQMATTSAWLYGMQQNSENRTNLALVNTGLADGSPNTFMIELFDGSTGKRVNTLVGITLDSHAWVQIGNILNQYAPGTINGYAHVTRTAGNNPFIAYAVINDGASPGQRTGDGAFVPMQLDMPFAAGTGNLCETYGLGCWDY